MARGSPMPLGIKVRLSDSGVQAGITCALCHSTVDIASGAVVHGAPNADLNAGLLLALASNSACYFTHTDVDPRALPTDPKREVRTSDGAQVRLPDPQKLEQAVDADTTFADGWYAVAITRAWMMAPDSLVLAAADRAQALSAGAKADLMRGMALFLRHDFGASRRALEPLADQPGPDRTLVLSATSASGACTRIRAWNRYAALATPRCTKVAGSSCSRSRNRHVVGSTDRSRSRRKVRQSSRSTS